MPNHQFGTPLQVPFVSLGGANHGWLKARRHVAFARYHEPARMNRGCLRVWNDSEIAPGRRRDAAAAKPQAASGGMER
ncbi:hypothetical protein [Siccirubricoccus sp. G192]|uniref:hypothetical protein n=1 Tax=Siccirubricoccus sp. G192 TaxID=2849651 RepID=UPI001C2CAD4B|nr:hypothetical protein [Siccirubricoccus sp. G192]MBV1800088.1 hypothetical protein [Siccirubricoccus sp. G192]